MKKLRFFILGTIGVLSFTVMNGQGTYTYRLNNNFHSSPPGGPDLIQIPNDDGLTGEFTVRSVPASTCEQGGDASGYFFEDNAGLLFNNPAGFIDQTYSLSMIFKVDELITPPNWVRILSFTHVDDIGIYLLLTNPPTSGTLEFWPYGTVGEMDFFNTVDFYQLILVRNSDGLIKIYINGQEFAEYDDSGTQAFVPKDPDNYIVFFRDHESVQPDEASPGFVSDIVLSTQAWNEQQVSAAWEDFCSSLLGLSETSIEDIVVRPNPFSSYIEVSSIEPGNNPLVQFIDLTGKELLSGTTGRISTESLHPGLYILRITSGNETRLIKMIKK